METARILTARKILLDLIYPIFYKLLIINS